MDTSTPPGLLGTLSDWLNAFADFAYANIGLTLLLLWCFTLFAMTEFAKPIIRRFVKEVKDKRLLVKLFPQVMGALTGYWFFPIIVSTTRWGETWRIPGFVGIGAGFLFGLVTIGAYELSRSKKFVRLTKALIKKMMYRIPGLSEEEVDTIMATERRLPTEEITSLQEVVTSLRQFGEVDMTFPQPDRIIIELRVPTDTASNDSGDPPADNPETLVTE